MRIWSFANCEYDEADRRLWVRNRAMRIGDRVLEVLEALLKAPDHSCSSLELRRVWGPGGNLTSVKDAIRQLRAAIAGDAGRDVGAPVETIRTVRGWGFQMAVPVTERTFAPNDLWRLLRRNAPAPELPGWRLQTALEPGSRVRVWEITNDSAHLVRVVKYATDPGRRSALRREVRAWEAFERGLPSQSQFVRIFSSHLTTWPCFVEMEHGGPNLMAWAEAQRAQGGLDRVICCDVMAALADAVAMAHSLGIIHNDLKPANVLVYPTQAQGRRWQVKVADFGVASVAPKNRLAEFHLGERTLQPASSGAGGSSLYHAPQIGADTAPTTEGDVYALGVILFQLLCGDFQKTPYPGWESEINDPVLQEDIEAACNVDPVRRPNAATFAERLRTIGQRRLALEEDAVKRRRSAHDTQQLAIIRARRPWVIAVLAILLVGICTSLWLYRRAVRERDLAQAINGFLADDLLTRASPYKTGIKTESLVDAINHSSPSIDQRFAHEPMIAARLHHTIARGLDKRMDYPDADREYTRAATLYQQAEGPNSSDAVIAQMQWAAMHARDMEAGSLLHAEAIYESQQPTMARIRGGPPDLPIWAAYAHGLIQMYSGDAQDAVVTFSGGLHIAEALPQFDLGVILTLKQLLAVSEVRLGEGAQAEVLIRQMMETVQRLHYTDKPNLPNLSVNLAQAYMAEQKNTEAINEVDRVYPVIARQMGEDNPLTITALGVRAQAERNLGLWSDATKDSLMVYQITAGKDVFMEAGSLSDAALYQCQAGHYAEGKENARKALLIGKSLATVRSGAEGSFLFSMASCLAGLRQYDESNKLLARINVPAVAQLYADADWSADFHLTRAGIALGEKNFPMAREELAIAKPACIKQGGAPYRLAWLERLTNELAHVV